MKKPNGADFTQLFPLIAVSIIVLFCIAIYASYVQTSVRSSTIVLPGGVTYTGN